MIGPGLKYPGLFYFWVLVKMINVPDQTGLDCRLPAPAERIVSLVPSQTELLYDLGLRDEVVGITKFCIHPAEWFRSKKRIGGTKNVNLSAIRALKPDLVIANKEENVRAQVMAIRDICPVWTSDIARLPDALDMILAVGNLTGRPAAASALANRILGGFEDLIVNPKKKQTVAYLIWQDPYMVAGGGTFIDDMVQRCGWEDVFTKEPRYPTKSLADLKAAEPDLVFLSSEPYPFRTKHVKAFAAHLPKARVLLVDGEMFSWYGSRLLHSAPYFQQLLDGLKN